MNKVFGVAYVLVGLILAAIIGSDIGQVIMIGLPFN